MKNGDVVRRSLELSKLDTAALDEILSSRSRANPRRFEYDRLTRTAARRVLNVRTVEAERVSVLSHGRQSPGDVLALGDEARQEVREEERAHRAATLTETPTAPTFAQLSRELTDALQAVAHFVSSNSEEIHSALRAAGQSEVSIELVALMLKWNEAGERVIRAIRRGDTSGASDDRVELQRIAAHHPEWKICPTWTDKGCQCAPVFSCQGAA